MSGSQFEVIEKRRTVPDLSDIDDDFRDMVEAMLQPDPQDRPISMAEIARMTRDDSEGTTPPTSTTPPPDGFAASRGNPCAGYQDPGPAFQCREARRLARNGCRWTALRPACAARAFAEARPPAIAGPPRAVTAHAPRNPQRPEPWRSPPWRRWLSPQALACICGIHDACDADGRQDIAFRTRTIKACAGNVKADPHGQSRERPRAGKGSSAYADENGGQRTA